MAIHLLRTCRIRTGGRYFAAIACPGGCASTRIEVVVIAFGSGIMKLHVVSPRFLLDDEYPSLVHASQCSTNMGWLSNICGLAFFVLPQVFSLEAAGNLQEVPLQHGSLDEGIVAFTPSWSVLGPFRIGTRGRTDHQQFRPLYVDVCVQKPYGVLTQSKFMEASIGSTEMRTLTTIVP